MRVPYFRKLPSARNSRAVYVLRRVRKSAKGVGNEGCGNSGTDTETEGGPFAVSSSTWSLDLYSVIHIRKYACTYACICIHTSTSKRHLHIDVLYTYEHV